MTNFNLDRWDILKPNPDLGKFWRVMQWKMMVYFMSVWSS
jgi:hypothetical protein